MSLLLGYASSGLKRVSSRPLSYARTALRLLPVTLSDVGTKRSQAERVVRSATLTDDDRFQFNFQVRQRA